MKILNLILLILTRPINLNAYIKIRSFLQLNYIKTKDDRFSTFLLSILKSNKSTEYYLRKVAADRIRVRDYVKKNCNEVLLPPLYWRGDFLQKSIFEKLPQKFYIKQRSSSGKTKYVNKRIQKITEINFWIWLNSLIDYGWLTRQWFYTRTNEFIVEGLISQKQLVDYKFFCKDGTPFLLQVDIDRKTNHKRNLYFLDKDGKTSTLIGVRLHHFDNDLSFTLPKTQDAFKIASKLSKEFSFVRVDLYIVNEKVFFGELTNLPGSGFEKFNPTIYDERIFRFMNQKTFPKKSFKE